MKLIQKKIMYFSFILIAGIVLTAAAFIKGNNDFMRGLGIGLTCVSLIKILQFLRLMKDDKRRKEYELLQTEERVILIVTRSGYLAFLLSVLIEYAAMIILIIAEQTMVASIICAIAGLQVFCYLLMYFYNNRKY